MNKAIQSISKLLVVVALALPVMAGAADIFSYNKTGDVLAGFRKTGVYAGNNELVVNLGSVTNFVALPIGTTTNITRVTYNVLTNAFPVSGGGLDDLQWSVFAADFTTGVPIPGSWVTPIGSFPPATLWLTRAAVDLTTQSASPVRKSRSSQQNTLNLVNSAGSGASTIANFINVSNTYNNNVLVTEPVTYSTYILSAFIKDQLDDTVGNFGAGGAPLAFNVENMTPDDFTSAQRCDFYQICPSDYTDPISGTTNSYFLGYFIFSPNGTMTFTRAAATAPQPPPPSNVTLVKVSGSDYKLQFGTTNGATYTLYYTNSAGLSTSVSNWPSWPTTIIGDGSITNFPISTTNANMFYRVGAH